MLLAAGCEVRGDKVVQAVDTRVKPASEDDWSTEYLDAIIAAMVVDGVDEPSRISSATARITPTPSSPTTPPPQTNS